MLLQKEKNSGQPDRRSQGRNDQQYGSNQYAQQGYVQQAPPAQGAPAGDPYAAYGGYAEYQRLWANYLQGQAATGGMQQPPQ
jgi:far upstream element-binding protein